MIPPCDPRCDSKSLCSAESGGTILTLRTLVKELGDKMKHRISLLRWNAVQVFALGATLCLVVAVAAPQQYPPQFPRANATEVLSNDRVNIWDAYWPKNQPTAMHRHIYDVISITVQGATIRATSVDGKVNEHTSQLGETNFSRKGLTHAEEGLSDVAQRKIFLELKTMASPPPDTSAAQTFPPAGTKQLVDNERLTAWDYTWPTGAKTPFGAETYDTVVVFLTGGTIRSANAKGVKTEVARKPGDVIYTAHSNETHTEEVVSGSPRAIVVQLK